MFTWTSIALLCYVLAQVALSGYVARKIRTEADYLVAGRNIGFYLASISLFATWFGAETVIGSSGAVAAGGLADGRADPFGYTVCLLLMAVLLAWQMRSRKYMTLGDFFRDRFGGATEKLAVFVMVPTSLMWASAQILAFATIFSTVTTIPLAISMIITTVILITYSSMGGMIGDIISDCIESSVILIGLLLMLAIVVVKAGGLGPAFEAIEPQRFNMFAGNESVLAKIDGWSVPILGSLVAQEAMSRLLAAKSPAVARNACIMGGFIYLIIGLIPLAIGLVGSTVISVPDDHDHFLPTLAMSILPTPLYVLLLGALISAILSTINSVLLAITALAGHNVIIPMFPKMKEKQKVLVEKGIVVAAGIICYLMAISGDSIYGLVELASSFGSAGLVVCVLIGLNSRLGGGGTALATLIAGIIFTLLTTNNYIKTEAPYLMALAGCIIVYAAGVFGERAIRRVKHA